MNDHHQIVIVGAGISGVGMAAKLRREGIEDFVICERNDDVGGTWFEHTYPGCACDVPTHLYSYSFARNPNWTRLFPRQDEILDYVRDTAAKHGVMQHVRFGCELLDARWDGERWQLATTTGDLSAGVLISAVGGTSEPFAPEIPGLAKFRGTTFHSARWSHEHDLRGTRVAVIGTGPASAQFVPRIAGDVEHMTVFQRTPPWILPHPDRPAPWIERQLYRALPPLQDVHRNVLFALYEAIGYGFHSDPAVLAPVEQLGRAHLRRQVRDATLREQLTPRYRVGCKRPMMSNTYYPALQRDNAALVTSAIEKITPTGIVTADGARHPVDTIIWGTGYRYSRSLGVDRITGRDGRTLGDAWRPSPRAYLGAAVAGFPNLFILLGPNSIGINSAIFSLEAQMTYVLGALREMARRGATAVEVRPEVLARYADEVDRRNDGSVWTGGGCASYYLDDTGRQFALWPGFASSYRRKTRRFDPAPYELTAA